MATATNSTEGEIVLGGDLTGTADTPLLVSTGVIPGVYSPAQRLYVDAKGRIVAVGALTTAEVVALPATATTSVKGLFSITTPDLTISSGAVSVTRASLAASVGNNGLIVVGNGFSVTGGGVLSIPEATSSVKGIASFSGTDFAVSSGAVAIPDYAALSLNLTVATGSVFGVVRSGTNITNTSGTFSVADATTSVKGVANYPSVFTVAAGVVSCPTEARTNVANTYTRSNNGSVQTVAGGATYTPNFQTGEMLADVTLNQNITINFPATLAPTGTVVRRNIVLRYNAGTPYTVTLSGTYLTNKTLTFTNAASTAVDNLTLICTDTVCYAILNETFL